MRREASSERHPVCLEPAQLRERLQAFLAHARKPALMEPGEPFLLLTPGHYEMETYPAHVTLQAWDDTRNLIRKVRGITRDERGKLVLSIHRFGGREGELHLIDLAHPRIGEWERRGQRLVFRERFRRMLARAFPDWRIASLSSEADLEHTLSPAFPRAVLIRGASAMAAVGAPPNAADFPSMLSFGLIWLDHVRRQHPKHRLEALNFWAPSPVAPMLSFFLPLFDPAQARFAMYLYSDEDFATLLDSRNYGNVSTHLEPCRQPGEIPFALEHTEAIALQNGGISLRVSGLEIARYSNGTLGMGREKMSVAEARSIAKNLYALRNSRASRGTLVYQQNPEAWLESIVRANLPAIDASLIPYPLYGQVPAIAGQDRTVLDLLAVDYTGRLAVLELKTSQDLHLPLQALDYWLRVKWHLDRGEFSRYGYFPGIELRSDPPRLLLIAPSLEFHPSTETILRYLGPEVEVVRIGLSADWRENPRVMFRLTGAERPHD